MFPVLAAHYDALAFSGKPNLTLAVIISVKINLVLNEVIISIVVEPKIEEYEQKV